MDDYFRQGVAPRILVFTLLSFFTLSLVTMLAEGHLHSPNELIDDSVRRDGVSASTWMLTLCSALIVGSTGVLPLLFIPQKRAFKHGFEPEKLNVLLSFAVGGLLGDVFLHILPEANNRVKSHDHSSVGLLVIAGLVCFLCAEKIMSATQSGADDSDKVEDSPADSSATTTEIPDNLRRRTLHSNGSSDAHDNLTDSAKENSDERISPAGYLNLLANIVDNFTHGLAVAASYLAGHRIGLLTTFAIIVHEVPHEIGDFAILLKSGFNRSGAAKAQLSTASGAVVGAAAGLLLQGIGNCVLWVLSFTAGGFLYIGLVSVLPTLLNETNPKQSVQQVIAMLTGIFIMKGFSLLD